MARAQFSSPVSAVLANISAGIVGNVTVEALAAGLANRLITDATINSVVVTADDPSALTGSVWKNVLVYAPTGYIYRLRSIELYITGAVIDGHKHWQIGFIDAPSAVAACDMDPKTTSFLTFRGGRWLAGASVFVGTGVDINRLTVDTSWMNKGFATATVGLQVGYMMEYAAAAGAHVRNIRFAFDSWKVA